MSQMNLFTKQKQILDIENKLIKKKRKENKFMVTKGERRWGGIN